MKLRVIGIVTVAALSACKPANQNAEVAADSADTMDMGQMGAMHDSTMMIGMQPGVMSAVQQDSMMQAMKNMPANMQFMVMMANHHTGLIAMARQAASRAADDSVKSIGRNLAAKQEQDKQSMAKMMQSMGGMQHNNDMMFAENKAQLDSLSARSGKDYDRYFLQTVITHHQKGIAMVDEFMGKMKGEAKQMAERMKAEQQKEIRELEGKLKTL